MTEKEIVSGFFIEGYQNHNYDFVKSVVSPAYIDHSPAGARSGEDAVNILKIAAARYAGMQAVILDLFAEGGMVATRVKFSGVREGERVSFEALENFKVENGLITESWGYWPEGF